MNPSPTQNRSRLALRRLLIVLFIALLVVIFSYGWNVTRIDFTLPQQPQRQENVGNALRELLSPNVFTQDYDVKNTLISFRIGCSDDFPAPVPVDNGEPYIIAAPHCGESDDIITLQGFNFASDGLARINWIGTDEERRIRQIVGTNSDNFVVGFDGTFSVEIQVPRIRGSQNQTHSIETQGRFPIGAPRLSETTYLVLEKMLETIFLALIATAVSILPSVILSFFAAGNLMHPIKMPLGNLLVTFTLFPVGAWLGATLLGALGQTVLQITQTEIGALAIIVSGGVIGALQLPFMASVSFLKKRDDTPKRNAAKPNPIVTILSSVLFAIVIITVFSWLGGTSLWIGRIASEGSFGFIGKFFGSIGQLFELSVIAVGAIVGAFSLSSMGVTLTRSALKEVTVPVSHILGTILGGLAGAILLGLTASIGLTMAWLGLLTPILAASLAAPILPTIYKQFVLKTRRPEQTERFLMTVLGWVGSIVGFIVVFSALNLQRALIEGSTPPRIVVASFAGLELYSYVLQAMLFGGILGAIGGAMAGTKANFPFGDTLYTTTRTILNALRSIEPLIMGLVFVIWVGIGPFAGVLALALHSVASLGKLYSEQIENIDAGPIEALESTGANRLQTIMYAVVPQIVPPYIAFTMYRWDINVRMSTIIGFVGGGGIGFLLQQQINLLRYRDAGVAVLAIAIVVSILDYASASIRQRVG